MKKLVFIALIAAWALMGTKASAQLPFGVGAGPRIGTTVKDNNFIAGGQIELTVASFTLAPSFEKVFVKNSTDYNISIDGQYEIFGAGLAKMFVGGGYVINLAKPDGFSRTTNHGFDIQGGGKANLSSLHIFGLLRYTRIEGNGDAALVFGVNFGI